MIFHWRSAYPIIDSGFVSHISLIPISFLFLLSRKVSLNIIYSWLRLLSHFTTFALRWILFWRKNWLFLWILRSEVDIVKFIIEESTRAHILLRFKMWCSSLWSWYIIIENVEVIFMSSGVHRWFRVYLFFLIGKRSCLSNGLGLVIAKKYILIFRWLEWIPRLAIVRICGRLKVFILFSKNVFQHILLIWITFKVTFFHLWRLFLLLHWLSESILTLHLLLWLLLLSFICPVNKATNFFEHACEVRHRKTERSRWRLLLILWSPTRLLLLFHKWISLLLLMNLWLCWLPQWFLHSALLKHWLFSSLLLHFLESYALGKFKRLHSNFSFDAWSLNIKLMVQVHPCCQFFLCWDLKDCLKSEYVLVILIESVQRESLDNIFHSYIRYTYVFFGKDENVWVRISFVVLFVLIVLNKVLTKHSLWHIWLLSHYRIVYFKFDS